MSNETILESLASLVDVHGGSTLRSKLDFLKQLPDFINQLQSIVAPNISNNPEKLDSSEELFSDILKKNRVTDLTIAPSGTNRKPIRVYVDGCFDLMHSGHYNALRQAKLLGDILIAGIHSDEEIQRNKGPPVMNNEERIALVNNCKWVGEVAFGVPYSPSVELLDSLNADFVVHGDDIPVNSEGVSAYDSVIKAGRCKIIKRTEGISTTNLVGRLLMHYREEHIPSQLKYENPDIKQVVNPPMTVFLPTARRISQFQSGAASSTPTQTTSSTASNNIVYIAGSFDMLHPGHVEFLQKAKELGDFLLVGIYDDETVKRLTGRYPIMSLHERVFNVLASKYVNDVIIGAPYLVTRELLTTMNIKVVTHVSNVQFDAIKDITDPYSVTKELGMYKPLEINCHLTVAKIGERIINDERIQDVYNRKKKKEEDYVKTNTESRQHLFEI